MNESNYQRDERIRQEEQRMTRLEDSYSAIGELLKLVRQEVSSIGRQLTDHAAKDEQTFTSIDNRLQSLSTQLNTLTTTLVAAQALEANVLSVSAKVSTFYTEQGINKVEVLWKENQNKQVRDAVYKQWWAWLTAGLIGGMAIASGAFDLLSQLFG